MTDDIEAGEKAEEIGEEGEETEETEVVAKEVSKKEDEEEIEEEAPAEVEEEEEIEKEKKKRELEEEIVEERFYTIPLRKAWISQRKKRAPRAMRIIRSFVERHMKIRTEVEGEEEAEVMVISNEVNEKIWSRGIEKPPRKIRVRTVKDKEGVITVHLAEGD